MELILLKVWKIKSSTYKEESRKVFSSPCKRSDICHELTGLGFLPRALFVSSWVLFAILLNCYKANGADFLWARCGTAEAFCECHLRKSATSQSWAKLTIIAQNTASQITEELPQRSVVFSTVLGEKKPKNKKDQHMHSESVCSWHLGRKSCHGRSIGIGFPAREAFNLHV